jgi:hypothetical protein
MQATFDKVTVTSLGNYLDETAKRQSDWEKITKFQPDA